MNLTEMAEIVHNCSYKPGWYVAVRINEDRPYIQLCITEESDSSLDSVTRDGTRTPWSSGKRYLSEHMCRQEVVGAVFGLIKDAEEHEMREWFRYKNASIFNPHLDPEALVTVAKVRRNFNMRKNPMTMEEPK